MIVSLIENMMVRELPTKIWFSDISALTVANGGQFKNGTDLTLYNIIDGLWKQIFAEINSGDLNYVEITENSGATYVAQTLPADAAVNYLTKVVESADSRLLSDPSARIMVTRSVADNFRRSLRTKTFGAGFLDTVEGGRPVLRFDGYEVAVRDDWDKNINSLLNNGTKLNKPHRILFTTPDNIPLATTSTDDFDTLVSFYDQLNRQNVIDAGFSLDAKFLESYLAVAAY
jgi:hypothetical protein